MFTTPLTALFDKAMETYAPDDEFYNFLCLHFDNVCYNSLDEEEESWRKKQFANIISNALDGMATLNMYLAEQENGHPDELQIQYGKEGWHQKRLDFWKRFRPHLEDLDMTNIRFGIEGDKCYVHTSITRHGHRQGFFTTSHPIKYREVWFSDEYELREIGELTGIGVRFYPSLHIPITEIERFMEFYNGNR